MASTLEERRSSPSHHCRPARLPSASSPDTRRRPSSVRQGTTSSPAKLPLEQDISKLRQPTGYPRMIGAMFWTIDADRRGNYNYSNVVGPELHSYAAARKRSVTKTD